VDLYLHSRTNLHGQRKNIYIPCFPFLFSFWWRYRLAWARVIHIPGLYVFVAHIWYNSCDWGSAHRKRSVRQRNNTHKNRKLTSVWCSNIRSDFSRFCLRLQRLFDRHPTIWRENWVFLNIWFINAHTSYLMASEMEVYIVRSSVIVFWR
jgi:hypothetical protein